MIWRQAARVLECVVVVVAREISGEQNERKEDEPARGHAQNKKKPEKK